MKCKCGKVAEYSLFLIIPARGTNREMRLDLKMRLCDECRERASVADLITDERWKSIERVFKQGGYVMPDRKRVRLEAESIFSAARTI